MIKKVKLLPLSILACIVPFIVYSHIYTANSESSVLFMNAGLLSESMNYYKSVFIIASGVLMLSILGYDIIFKSISLENIFKKREQKVVIGMIVFILISWILSSYPITATLGFTGRFEGSLVWLTYVVSVFYSLVYVNTKEDVEYVGCGYLYSLYLMGLIGLFEFFGYGLF